MKRILLCLVNGMGLGLSPHCSGTTGALLGLPLAVALTALRNHPWAQGALAFAFVLLAIPICDWGERHYGRKDDGRIVADEWMLLPMCFVAQQPVWNQFATGNWVPAVLFTGMAFIVSRVFDILKLFPAFRLQRVHGGLGIVLDDFFANLYAWPAIYALDRCLLQPAVVPLVRELLGVR